MPKFDFDKVIGTVINRRWIDKIDFPHRDFLDLCVAYRYIVRMQDTIIYQLITDDLLKGLEISEEMLYNAAVKNYRGDIWTMAAMLSMIDPEITEVSQCNGREYVLTNPDFRFGSFGLTQTDILAKHAMMVGSDLAIIPSSVHELIILPLNQIVANEVVSWISEVNDTMVDTVDVLSNNLYIYKRETNEVVIFER